MWSIIRSSLVFIAAVLGFMDTPSRFGKYELMRRLAKGGMAEIFLARSFGVEGFERHLVIKRILPQLASSPQFVGLFIKEAKISASLSHPNIVQIYELGRVGTDHYIAMEYIHGRDLTRINKSMRAEGGQMPVPLAVFVVASILRGLAHAQPALGPPRVGPSRCHDHRCGCNEARGLPAP